MTRALTLACIIVAAAMLMPGAAAQASSALRAPVGAVASGPVTALFAVPTDGFSFQAKATTITIDVSETNYTFVPNPKGDRPVFTQAGAPREYATVLGAGTLTLVSTSAYPGFLVQDGSGDSMVRASHRAPLIISSATSPALRSDPANADPSLSRYGIATRLSGDFVNLSGLNGDYDVTGTITLDVFGVDYNAVTAAGSSLHQTGDQQTGPATGRLEVDHIVLEGATLHVHAPGAASLFSLAPVVTLPEGGALDILDDAGHAIGTAPVASGGIRLDPGLATASVRAPGPHTLAPQTTSTWLLVVALVLALALAAALALVRRARRDDLGDALLAMEQRRYADALPPLRRLRAKRPHDPAVLLDEAICLEETGALAEARAAYEATLAQWPTHAEAHYFLARTLARLRQRDSAAEHLARALDLDPRLEELARRDAMLGNLPGETGVSA